MTGTQHDRSSTDNMHQPGSPTPAVDIGMENAGEGHWQTWYTPIANTSAVDNAGEFIRKGGLVAFPTETVYGLGGDAFNSEAVARIYDAKGRPGDNPLILHIASRADFDELTLDPPPYALALIESFWPGPLTLVAAKKTHLPRWLGGHPKGSTETIGIRMPVHPMARALIVSSGRVIAAPSANKAGKPSPTTAAHVLDDFPNPSDEGIIVLDGGNVSVGLESTVVDITGERPCILRLGAVTVQMIRDATGLDVIGAGTMESLSHPPRSPGMKYRHYAPHAPMTIVSGSAENSAAYIVKEYEKATKEGRRVGVLIPSGTYAFFSQISVDMAAINPFMASDVIIWGANETDFARNLFSCLRRFDKLGVDVIYAQGVPDRGLGAAIMDRMRKAAEGRVVYV